MGHLSLVLVSLHGAIVRMTDLSLHRNLIRLDAYFRDIVVSWDGSEVKELHQCGQCHLWVEGLDLLVVEHQTLETLHPDPLESLLWCKVNPCQLLVNDVLQDRVWVRDLVQALV